MKEEKYYKYEEIVTTYVLARNQEEADKKYDAQEFEYKEQEKRCTQETPETPDGWKLVKGHSKYVKVIGKNGIYYMASHDQVLEGKEADKALLNHARDVFKNYDEVVSVEFCTEEEYEKETEDYDTLMERGRLTKTGDEEGKIETY